MTFGIITTSKNMKSSRKCKKTSTNVKRLQSLSKAQRFNQRKPSHPPTHPPPPNPSMPLPSWPYTYPPPPPHFDPHSCISPHLVRKRISIPNSVRKNMFSEVPGSSNHLAGDDTEKQCAGWTALKAYKVVGQSCWNMVSGQLSLCQHSESYVEVLKPTIELGVFT